MASRVHIDFETYSEAYFGKGPKNVGSYRYAEDPSTEVVCLGLAFDDEPSRLWWAGDPIPERYVDHYTKGGEVHAWNDEFEVNIHERILHERLGWPRVPFECWRDTQAHAMSFGFPGALGDTAKALGLGQDKQKDKRGSALIQKLSSPCKPTKAHPSTRWTFADATLDYLDFGAYCKRDVEVERGIGYALPTHGLSPFELAVWRDTLRLNLEGWTFDTDALRGVLTLLDAVQERGFAEISSLTDGKITTVNQRERFLKFFKLNDFTLPNFQADTIDAALAGDFGPRNPTVQRLLEIRRDLGLASTGKYRKAACMLAADGRIHDLLMYHGAATGRDAGKGIQIQNFPRAAVSYIEDDQAAYEAETERAFEFLGRYEDDPDRVDLTELTYGAPPHYASAMLRSCLTASPGCELFCSDFSSIENRITVWLADDEFGIQLFTDGLDQYKMFARDFYNVAYEDVTKKQRGHGKPAILGCCFGMGKKTYVEQAAQYGQTVTLEQADETVKAYRAQYPGVVDLWEGLDLAAKAAIQFPGKGYAYKKIRFKVVGEFLYMRLPSGRLVAYHKPRVDRLLTPWGEKRPTINHMGRATYAGGKWLRVKLIPGRLTENAVQATARDALMLASRAVVEGGFRLVGRVHDEVIAEAPIGTRTFEEFNALVLQPVPWVNDEIPITAAGWVGRRYRKD